MLNYQRVYIPLDPIKPPFTRGYIVPKKSTVLSANFLHKSMARGGHDHHDQLAMQWRTYGWSHSLQGIVLKPQKKLGCQDPGGCEKTFFVSVSSFEVYREVVMKNQWWISGAICNYWIMIPPGDFFLSCVKLEVAPKVALQLIRSPTFLDNPGFQRISDRKPHFRLRFGPPTTDLAGSWRSGFPCQLQCCETSPQALLKRMWSWDFRIGSPVRQICEGMWPSVLKRLKLRKFEELKL